MVLIVYDSRRGRAGRAADAVAEAAAASGMTATTRAIDDVDAADLEAADALIVGCWTPGKVPFGDSPTRSTASWIERLPSLEGKPAGVFCTYRFFPHTFADMTARTSETLDQLSSRLELKGAQVVATRAIHYTSIEQDAATLTERFCKGCPQMKRRHPKSGPARERAAHNGTHERVSSEVLSNGRGALANRTHAGDNGGTAERTPDAIAHRLAAILDELAALPDGPSPERFKLLTERDTLRSEAAGLQMTVDENRSSESLDAELSALKKQRNALVNARGGYVTGHSADSAGRVGASLTRIGKQLSSSSEIERKTARISQIEGILASKRTTEHE